MKDLGKIDQHTLERLFPSQIGYKNPNVLQGPSFGVDTAWIKLNNDQLLITASDPLSLIPSLGLKASAWLSVHLIANDIATSGHAPEFAQFILNLPKELSQDDYFEYWEYLHQFCEEIGVAITGGHTGFIDQGNSTLAGGGTMFCVASPDTAKSAAHAQPNQSVILTKSAALSSSAILAKSFPNFIQDKLGNKVWDAAQSNFYQTSVLPELTTIKKEPCLLHTITALHDVTEGGVLGALYELSQASAIGIHIEADRIPIREEVAKVCSLFKIDPLYSIGAGSLIIICDNTYSEVLIKRLHDEQIQAALIGHTYSKEEGCWMERQGKKTALQYVETDPYWEAYFKAITQHLD